MKRVIFTLTCARSGTLYLRDLFQKNVQDCVCRHEPFFDWGNPTMLGPAIYGAYAGRLEKIRALLAKKRAYVERLPGIVYLESSHAFLKSAYLAALEFFPEMRLIHLIRDPFKVAKSEAYREEWRRRMRAPFHYYTGDDGQRHFFWALTGHEEIYSTFDFARLSLFQRYLIQWIEIENRAMRFLDEHRLHDRCFTLSTPGDLNQDEKLRAMWDFFGLHTKYPVVKRGGRKNKSLGRTTIITGQDKTEAHSVLEQLPARYLEIFQHEPYAEQPWSGRFQLGKCNDKQP